MDERLEVKPDPNVQVGPMDPLDVVEVTPTSGGVALTDEVVQRLADEAECGYDLDRFTRRSAPSEGSRRCMIYRDGTVK